MVVEAMAMAVMAVEGGCEGLHTVGAVRARVAVGKAAGERAEPEDAMAAGARASLCSRRSRYSPSRRSRRRLRPWFGPACSRHPERHTRMGKGRHVRTLPSIVDPRSSKKALGARKAVGAREEAVRVGVATEVAVAGVGMRGAAEAAATAAEARARVGAVRAAAKVGVAGARVEAETAMAVEAMAMAVMAVKGGCEGLHTVGAVRARVAVGKAAGERAEPEDAMAAGARASLCSRRSRYSPSRRSRRRLRPWFGPACSRHPERHTKMGKGRHVRTLPSIVDPRSSETAAGAAAAAAAAAAARGGAARVRARAEAKGA